MAGLTIMQKRLIEALSRNDITDAKKYAVWCMEEDKTKKNDAFIANNTKLLSDNKNILPNNLRDRLIGQLPEDFHEDRYYLSRGEKEIFENIMKMRIVADRMNELQIGYTNTTLLYGESGTGKTLFGKYTAYKLNLPFYYLNFSTMIDSYLGGTAKNLNYIFEYIKQLQCVLMLDEIDCIAMKRKSGGQSGAEGELERTTISIMQEFDRLTNNLVVIAATNRLDIVDDALLRRFSLKHEFLPFTTEENTAMVMKFLKATGTEKYVTVDEIAEIIRIEKVQGNIMPRLIRHIGRKIYDELEK